MVYLKVLDLQFLGSFYAVTLKGSFFISSVLYNSFMNSFGWSSESVYYLTVGKRHIIPCRSLPGTINHETTDFTSVNGLRKIPFSLLA